MEKQFGKMYGSPYGINSFICCIAEGGNKNEDRWYSIQFDNFPYIFVQGYFRKKKASIL